MKKRLLSAILLACLLSACMTKRAHYDTPEIPMPARFTSTAKSAEDASRQFSPLKNVLPNWWRLLNSQELNELVDRGLANNHELRIATNRIGQARSRTEQARADQLPVITLPYSANSAAPSEGIGSLPAGGALTSKRTYQTSVRADWRPDLWGEVQAMFETAELQLWRATFTRDDVQRALVANIVSSYTSYLSLSDRLRIAEESESVLSGLLASVRDRLNSGDATIIEFEQQRSAVFQVRSTIPQLFLQRDQAKNRLASLVGTVPAALHLSGRGLETLSYPVVVPGLPSALLLRRPDVRVMEATMLAADANIDAVRARIFPTMSLNGQIGTGSFKFSQLLQPSSIFWAGLASVTAAIFDYGKRANDVAIARSVHEELLETYVQILYGAVREVEDAQSSIDSVGKRLKIQEQSVAAAFNAWTYSRESYQAGAIDYMVLLDTERTYHSRLDELNRIRLEHFLAMVELFQSIGGGVETNGNLPGKGQRALQLPDVDVGLVQSVYQVESPAAIMSTAKLVDGFGKAWLAELPGMATHSSVLAARRDLYARFPDLMTRQRIVLVRQEGRVADEQNRERSSWYRLFVGSFSDQTSAAHFCAVLKTQFMRCNPLLNATSAFANDGKWLQLSEPVPEPNQRPSTQPDLERRVAMPTVPVAPMPMVASAKTEPARVEPVRALPKSLVAPRQDGAIRSGLKPAPVLDEPLLLAPEVDAPVVPNSGEPVISFDLRMSYEIKLPKAPVLNVGSGYAVQVYAMQYAGRFSQEVVDRLKKRFERPLSSWKEKGYAPYLYKSEELDGNVTIAICIGSFVRPEDASLLADRIRAREDAVISVVAVSVDAQGHPLQIDAQLKPAKQPATSVPLASPREGRLSASLTLGSAVR